MVFVDDEVDGECVVGRKRGGGRQGRLMKASTGEVAESAKRAKSGISEGGRMGWKVQVQG